MKLRITNRIFIILLCLIIFTGITIMGTTTAEAAQPLTKTVSLTVTLNGVHALNDFSTTYSYDDGEYVGTLIRQDNTLRNIVRSTYTVTYTYQSDTKYPNDKSASGQYDFPSTNSASYYDSLSGQYFAVTLSKSGSPYFSGSVTSKTLYWIHKGYQYDPINHTKLGYMSNNSSTYYSGQYRFSDPPRQPSDYYGPTGESGLGWVQYGAPEWDGALQDAEQEPWRSICLAYHGVTRFVSESGRTNRYRKPVRIYYRRTASCQYIYQNYSGTATVTDTTITYTGTVTLKAPDLTVTSLTTDKTIYEAGETVTVNAAVKNQGKSTASNFIVRLTTNPSITTQNISITLAADASTTAIYTFTAPINLDYQNVTLTVTADPNNIITESDESNNARSTSVAINALRPDIEVVSSTVTDWYSGKEVTVSATVRNLTSQPVASVTIQLTIDNVSYTEQIPIPGNRSNLAVFRITVPDEPGDYTVQITVDPNGVLNETNESNNTLTQDIQVTDIPVSVVVDPDDYAMEQYYEAYGLMSMPSASSSNYHTWHEVRLEDENYVTKTYWARLTTSFSIEPDSRIAESDTPETMESGYGIQVSCTTTLTTNYDCPEKLVGIQMVWVRYPESAYGQLSQWQYVNDDLETTLGIEGDKITAWQLAINPYSVTESRLHYSPLWFPDVNYTVLTQAFYAWSPVGQHYSYETDSVMISGDMYDRISTVKR